MVNIFQNVPPLDWQTPIVNQDGTPSAQFIRIWKYAIENTDYTIDGLDGKVNKAGDTMTGALTVLSDGQGVAVRANSAANSLRGILSATHVDAAAPSAIFTGERSRGTYEAPTAVVSGDGLVALTVRAYDGTSYDIDPAYIRATVDGAVSTNIVPTRWDFATASAVGATVKLSVRANGDIQMGGNNTVITSDRHPQLRSYITSGLPSATGRTGQLVYVSDASAGQQVQFSNGSSWVPPSGGGGGSSFQLLDASGSPISSGSTWTWSTNVTEVIVTGLSAYNNLIVLITGITTSVSSQRAIQFSSNGGTTWYNTSGDYVALDSAGVQTNLTQVNLHNTSTTAARASLCHINMFNTSVVKPVTTKSTVDFYVTPLAAMDAIRLFPTSGGNLTAGSLYVYGA